MMSKLEILDLEFILGFGHRLLVCVTFKPFCTNSITIINDLNLIHTVLQITTYED
jgi:hypothetical protein